MTRSRDNRDRSRLQSGADRLSASDLMSHDLVLEGLIFSANAEGQEYGLTLTIGGTVVSGVLTADAEFLRFLADAITEGQEPDDAQALRDDLEQTARRTEEKLRQVLAQPRRAGGRPIPIMPTVHLRDATVFLPGGQSVQVPYWRGRVEAVDGWFLGIIGQRPEP